MYLTNINNSANYKNTILVPTDFSEVCGNAINHTLQIAKHIRYKVLLLHVINKDTLYYLEKNSLTTNVIENKLKEQSEEFTKNSEVQVDYVIKEGKLLKEIHNTVQESGINMIVLGTHGKVGFQTITGSYALKLITKTTVPTIVVQQKTVIKPYKNIVFPVTIGVQGRQKVNWAIYISKVFNSTIHLIPKDESNKYQKMKIDSKVKQIKNIFDKHNIKYNDRNTKKSGSFAKQVIEYAVYNNCDLILNMVSTKGVVPFFDSHDEQIIFNTSQIPVICINPIGVEKQ